MLPGDVVWVDFIVEKTGKHISNAIEYMDAYYGSRHNEIESNKS